MPPTRDELFERVGEAEGLLDAADRAGRRRAAGRRAEAARREQLRGRASTTSTSKRARRAACRRHHRRRADRRDGRPRDGAPARRRASSAGGARCGPRGPLAHVGARGLARAGAARRAAGDRRRRADRPRGGAARARRSGWRSSCSAATATCARALARADVVSLHAPLTPETRHLIDARALAPMRPGTILVNTARGGLVDQAALLDAHGTMRRAALDVTDPEPPPPGDPIAGCSACARRPAHRLGHPRSARADDRRRRRQPAGRPRRRAAPHPAG